MIAKTVGWLFHWLGQGLKLWLFAVVAALCLLPLYIPLGLLERGSDHFGTLGLIAKISLVLGYILCYAVGIAVFTAILASQLKDHPLRPFTPQLKPGRDFKQETRRAEQDGAHQPATRPASQGP